MSKEPNRTEEKVKEEAGKKGEDESVKPSYDVEVALEHDLLILHKKLQQRHNFLTHSQPATSEPRLLLNTCLHLKLAKYSCGNKG